MKSRWSDSEFRSVVDGYVRSGLNPDLATRVYTTRLLGGDPQLVLHGGGNTSVKTVAADADGSEVAVICVKGSGWDMGTIEPAGLPAVRLTELAALARFDTLSDVEMVRQQRRLLMDPAAPNPSVEAILHALIPSRHVDHTHANAIVALTDQPDGEALVRRNLPRHHRRPLCDARLRSGEGLRQGARRGARRNQHDPPQTRDLHLVRRRAREL